MRSKVRLIFLAIVASIALLAVACGSDDDGGFSKTGDDLQIAVILAGTATGETRDINGSPMECFDVKLYSPSSGEVIGTGTDCLDLATISPIGEDGGFQINNTTFFHFDEGTIVSLSRTTIQPISDPLPTSGPTHLTSESSSDDNIIANLGTGDFKGASGSTRLSGSVDMTEFTGPGSPITFDCIFVIKVKDA